MDILSSMNYLDKSFRATCRAIEHFSTEPCIVNIFLPIKPCYEYDLIVVTKVCEEHMVRVKTIQTESQAPSGSYIVNLRKSGGYRNSKEYKAPFDPKECDLIFVVSPDGNYAIPSEEVHQTRAICLSMFQKYKCIIPS
jgi:hypothetical protein